MTRDAARLDDEMTGQPRQPARQDLVLHEEHEAGEAAQPGGDLDLVRLYFHEIGRVRLLSATQEAAIGRRIEEARRELVGRLVEIPIARRALAEIGAGLRRGDLEPEDVIVLPEGG